MFAVNFEYTANGLCSNQCSLEKAPGDLQL